MSDNNLYPVVPRDVLVKQGISAAASIAGGIILVLISASSGIFGIVLSGLALLVGAGALFSRDKEAKKPGFFMALAGGLGLAVNLGIPVLQTIAGPALGIGALGFLAMGIWKGIKFFRGLKSRQ